MSDRSLRPGRLDLLLATLALLLGGGSLLLFGAFLLGVDLGVVRLGGGGVSHLLIDAGLCVLFFLQHSVMLRRGFRARLDRVVPRLRHGVVYAAASGLALAALVLLWQRSETTVLAACGVARWVLHGVQMLAFSSTLWAWRALDGFDPFGIAPLRAGVADPAPPLTVRGPYRWVRHPLYLAFLVAAWAMPVLTTDRLLFNGLWTAWVVVGCLLEERDLVATYGDAYRAYRRRVPMLLPWPLRTPR